MKPLIDAGAMLAARPPGAAAMAAGDGLGELAAGEPPPDLVGVRMAEFVLLTGLPLRYLVPDPALLPGESLRFFHVDPGWMEQLLAGILSIGLGPEAAAAAPEAHAAVAAALPRVRDARRGRPATLAPTVGAALGARPGEGLCGLLLRSTLVERYPGLILKAWVGAAEDDEDPDSSPAATALAPLRLERITPSILVALWERAPDIVRIQEPPSTVRLGVRAGGTARSVRVRLPDGTEKRAGGAPVDVPVNVDAAGVADLGGLAATLAAAGHIADADDGAALAMQLVRPPARRRFRRTGTP